MKKVLDFEILENGIILKKSEYIRIFEVFPKNFVLEETDSKNKFLLSFNQFLLALKFPVQIVAINSQIKREEILQYTKDINDEKFRNIYKKNIIDLCKNKELSLYTQRFFIIYKIFGRNIGIPFSKEFTGIKKEILINDNQIEFLLNNIFLRYKILKSKKDIILLFKNFV
ncbi:hypothetical protein M1145_00525 [Patescibacteria group bacterium]|nr:hypothetical protein [Patescibacteria group bacterium]